MEVTEESGVHKDWYVRAKNMDTPERLAEFVKELSELEHDYGTICHAVAASALAAGHVVDHSPNGGITGFHAVAIMWEFISHWLPQDGPQRLISFDDMLYPQYERKFRTITKGTWKWLQKTASDRLVEHNGKNRAHEDVRRHWKRVAAGHVPFGYRVEAD